MKNLSVSPAHNDLASFSLVIISGSSLAFVRGRRPGRKLKEALRAGLISDGMGMIIPISRGISTATDPGKAANEYKSRVNKIRDEVKKKEREQHHPRWW